MQSFLVALGVCSVTMSIAALLFLALSPGLSKKYSPKWQYYAWLIIVVGLIVPFRPNFGFAVFKIDIPDSASVVQQYEQETDVPDEPLVSAPTATPDAVMITEPNAVPADNAEAYQPPLPESIVPEPVEPMESAPFMPEINVYQIMGLIWLTGVVFMIIYNSIKHYRFMKMLNRWSEAVTDEEALNVLYDTAKGMAIFNTVKLKVFPLVKSPLMVGFINPTIIVHSIDIPKDELAFILVHELTHYKRKDLWYKCLVLTATIIHWFNPVVYLISKEIDIQCEISCDWEVIHNADGKSKQQYSETIISVIRQQSKMKTMLSTSFYGGKRGMKKRIFSIMNTATKKVGLTVVSLALILTMGAGMTFAANLIAPSNEPSKEKEIEIGFNGDISSNAPTEEQTKTTPDDGTSPATQPTTIEVNTFDPIDIGDNTKMLLGLFANNGGAVEYGFYWGTENDPATKITKGTSSENALSFTHELTGLQSDTTYYYRAYAGTVMGEVMSFRLPATAARSQSISVSTIVATSVGSNTSTLLGLFANNSGAVEYGFYWGTTNNPSTKAIKGTSGEAFLSFTHELAGLQPDTTYYYRAYAGTVIGEVASFKTSKTAPIPTPTSTPEITPAPTASAITAATITATNLQNRAAGLNGSFANNSGTVEYGFYWGTTNVPMTKVVKGTSSATTLNFSHDLTGLAEDTTYYFRAYAGATEGSVQSFRILASEDFTVSTSVVSNIKSNSAALNGSFANNSGTVEYGFYWGTTSVPMTKVAIGTSSAATLSFTHNLTNLMPDTTYYYRTYAGESVGLVRSLNTATAEVVTVSTSAASGIKGSSATLNGSFANNSDMVEYGFYWGTTSNPTTKVIKGTSYAGPPDLKHDFTYDLTGLKPNTTYYFMAYAGADKGELRSFKTLPAGGATASTSAASAVRIDSATLNGSFANNSGTVEYGFYWGTANNPTTKVVKGTSSEASLSFTHDLSLTSNTTYYFKAYAGASEGVVQSVRTSATEVVTSSTFEASNIKSTSATISGLFENNNGTVEYGFCWGTTIIPETKVVKGTSSAAALSFTYDLTNLTPNTTYYFMAYAGTTVPKVRSFRTTAAEGIAAFASAASAVNIDSATLNGSFNNNSGTVEYGFYWGTTTKNTTKVVKGMSSEASLSFSYDLTSLEPDTDYWFRAYAGESESVRRFFITSSESAVQIYMTPAPPE